MDASTPNINRKPPMNRLDQIGVRHNTDKASLDRAREDAVSGKQERPAGHDYLRKYGFFFEKFTDKRNCVLMELGAGPDWNIGASAKVWKEYFWREDFKLHVVDIKATAMALKDDRTDVTVGDLGDNKVLQQLAEIPCDIIIDDASHFWGHQLAALCALFPAVKPGGIYIIEDIHTSFGPKRNAWAHGCKVDAFTVVSGLVALVAGKGRMHPLCEAASSSEYDVSKFWRQIDSITMINDSCLITKKNFY
jgi:hypothetical protein